MGTELTARPDVSTEVREAVMIQGDLAKLTKDQKQAYYIGICERLGLDWVTRPFDFILLNGKLVLYARKDCTDQLRRIHQVKLSLESKEIDREGGVVTVTVKAELPNGRTDLGIGAAAIILRVPVKQMDDKTGKEKIIRYDMVPAVGDDFANAVMKSETKAKRRATLSICGLGFLDETEIDTIPAAAVKQPTGGHADQVKAIKDLAASRGVTVDSICARFDVKDLTELNTEQADGVIHFLKSL